MFLSIFIFEVSCSTLVYGIGLEEESGELEHRTPSNKKKARLRFLSEDSYSYANTLLHSSSQSVRIYSLLVRWRRHNTYLVVVLRVQFIEHNDNIATS